MTAKFSNNNNEILEVTRNGDKVDFFVYEFGEEHLGRSVSLSVGDVNDLVKHLESLQLIEQ
jgi:hypothetical protein